MTNDNSTTDGGDDFDARLLTGSFALDALSAEEASALESLLGSSDSLREETDELVETAALLGLSIAPIEPSARLKSELMAKLSLTPQLPALPQQIPDAPAAAEPVAAEPAAAEPAAAAPSSAETRARARWFARPAGALAAVAAAAALFVGGGFVGSAIVNGTGSSNVADSSAAELARITAAADVQRASVDVAGGGTATVVWSNELGRSAVLAEDLPELPEGKVYEAWYIDSKGPVPAGTFDAAASGTSWHVLDGSLTAGDVVGVTVEPAGGSQQPTTEPIFAVQSA
ncbi:anti-sigma factor [Herbiconiux sp. P18]|uniref:anti-sigma factor n=1 Tax=Herbiconiux liangxiaofengii TaxID=3342795 RepID=UPI0035B9752D